uniref:Uncharacterized protein n=1 Tax=Anguilla anguilla TaxID=7936 RepID=A0A0E9WNP5_ANGAN
MKTSNPSWPLCSKHTFLQKLTKWLFDVKVLHSVIINHFPLPPESQRGEQFTFHNFHLKKMQELNLFTMFCHS